MFQKIVFLVWMLCVSWLFANDTLDVFIDEQMLIEAKFLDNNLTLDEKLLIKKTQEQAYDKFFFDYAANSDEHLESANPYTTQISRLKISLNSNKRQGNTNAVARDEVLLKGFETRNMMRSMLHDTLRATKDVSKLRFKEKLTTILTTHLSNYVPQNDSAYLSLEQNNTSPIVSTLLSAVKNQNYLDGVLNTFSASLAANSTNIYITTRISGSKLLGMLNTLNTTPYGLTINRYLGVVNLNLAKMILILLIILMIFAINRAFNFMMNRFLHHHNIKDEDIEYINSRITKLLNLITSVLIVHVVTLVFMDMNNEDININKLFGIVYVLLIAVLLYRVSKTAAAMRMEQIKNSKILKNEVMNLAMKANNVFIFMLALIAILKILGVNLTALLSGLGIAGAAVAFAAKDSIANIFGSVSILASDVFEQGDWIETSDINGTVVEIGLRASTVRTFDNALISIPNSQLANYSVKNWSRRSIGRRIAMTIGVTYQSDLKDIRHAIEQIRAMLKEHPSIANDETPYQQTYRQTKLVSFEDFKGIKRSTVVYLDAFADSSINIFIECFSRSVEREAWLKTKEDILFKIAEILETNRLAFAFPSMTLYKADTAVDLKVSRQ